MTLIERHAGAVGADLLAHFPVTVIEGARQVGKSTLAAQLMRGRPATTVTLDDVATRAAAEADPVGFVDQAEGGTLLLDEVQLRPELLPTIKAAVDRDRRPGRFLLTGSADLLALRGETDSLAGRAVTLRLRGLSQGEIYGRPDDLVHHLERRIAAGDAADLPAFTTAWTRADYVDALGLGGFPEVRTLPERLRSRWIDGYAQRVLERDAATLPGGRQAQRLRSVATLLAANQAGEVVKARIAGHAGIPPASMPTYLDALAAVFLTDTLPPWTPNLTNREVGRAKGVVADSALALRLARVTPAQLLPLTSPTIGGFVEAFVVEELLKQQTWSGTEFDLFHFRDRSGTEVDIVAELADGRVIAFEVKSSATYKTDQFSGLTFLRDRLGDRFVAGVVLGMAPTGYRYADRLWGLPIASLWEL